MGVREVVGPKMKNELHAVHFSTAGTAAGVNAAFSDDNLMSLLRANRLGGN